ncbi:MAG: 1,4-dihydroxy-2-naphthoate octaprenyltransferase [Bacteroidaceae bacterium]|nr:1,4-dihydroxy-2-naphthoate octaprenyltransferase [Bacteroidaceae bacterium]
MTREWIEAMRLRTLPVSIAGVIAGTGCAVWHGGFRFLPAFLCLLFAVLAQVASNFGNEYYDFVNGIDKSGRDGFRRGVTEGDITPTAMRTATFATLAAAAITGCTLLFFGGWWLIIAGTGILLFALAYSAGPYPLSHHGLGDLAVIVFFGGVPVNLTCYLQCGSWEGIATSLPTSIAVGLLAANVLVVNNYRDADDDRSVGKRTTVVIFGRKAMGWVYLASGITAMAIMVPVWMKLPVYTVTIPLFYLFIHIRVWRRMTNSQGSAINPLLGKTAVNLLLFSLLLTTAFTLYK